MQPPTDRMCPAYQRIERDRIVFGIEKPIKLRAAGVHLIGERCLIEALSLHQRIELTRDNALERPRRDRFKKALLFEKGVE